MVDLHSHILPNIDDGAVDLQESLEMAKTAQKQGFTKIIATPHFIENEINVGKDKIIEVIAHLNAFLEREGIDIDILPGNEIYISPNLPELLKHNEVLTLNNTSYILVEFPMANIPLYAEEILYEVRLLGYKPIIAHPERCLEIIEDPNRLKYFIEQGNYVQMNSLSATGGFGSKVKETAKILLKHKMVHFIGTDAHSSKGRAPKIEKAIAEIQGWVGDKCMNKLIHNGRALMNDEEVHIMQPLSYIKKNKGLQNIWNQFLVKKKGHIDRSAY